MADFIYKARNASGDIVSGTMSAADETAALAQLQTQGLFPFELHAITGIGDDAVSSRGMSSKRAAVCCEALLRHVLLYVRAHLALTKAAESFADANRAHRQHAVFGSAVAASLAQGQTFSASLAQAGYGDRAVLSLLSAGETAGELSSAIEQALAHVERRQTLMRAAVAALTYPAILLFGGVVSIAVIVYYVVPKVRPAIEHAGAVSGLSRFLFSCADIFRDPLSMAVFATGVVVLIVFVRRYPAALARVFPPLARFIAAREEFVCISALRMLVAAKVALPDACAVAGSCGSLITSRRAAAVSSALRQGRSLGQLLSVQPLFGSFFASVVIAGHESGQLEHALSSAEAEAKERTERLLHALCVWAEPVALAIVGIIVGGIVLALMLPLMETTQRVY